MGMPGVWQNACYSLKQDLRGTVDLRASSEYPQTSSLPLSKNSPCTLSVLAPISRMSTGPPDHCPSASVTEEPVNLPALGSSSCSPLAARVTRSDLGQPSIPSLCDSEGLSHRLTVSVTQRNACKSRPTANTPQMIIPDTLHLSPPSAGITCLKEPPPHALQDHDPCGVTQEEGAFGRKLLLQDFYGAFSCFWS